MLSYIWETFVCLLETFFYTYLFYRKIGLKPNHKKRVVVFILVMSSAPSVLTLLNVSLFLKMIVIQLVSMLTALWSFDCNQKRKRYKAVLWSSCILIIVTVADFISYSIALAIIGEQLSNLERLGSARIQFTLIYLLLIAAMVWLLTHLGERDPEFPLSFNFILLAFIGIGIFAVESMIGIALVLQMNPTTIEQAHTLSLLGYCFLFLLFALLIVFEYVGVVLRKNRALEQQHQLALIEEQQYQFMVTTAESLAHWKHDYQGQLRLISALIADENYLELHQFATRMDAELGASESFLFTGNRTMDAVISLRMLDANRHNIPFETKLYLPERLPLEEVYFSVLIGNILDNAVEACLKVDSTPMKIYFEMKPWKKMLYIFCSNTSDGKYLRGENETLLSTKKTKGHGIGMRRIQEIVEEAGGACQFSPEAHQFSVSIMLPLKEIEDEHCNSRKRSKSCRVPPNTLATMVQGTSNNP